MSLLTTKATIESYFISGWTTTTKVQFEGAPFDYSALTSWISLKFVPVRNDLYAFDGTSTGRVNNNAQMQVFVYAQQVPLCYSLADSVITFLSGKKLGADLNIGQGQVQSSALKLDSGWIELMVTFEVNNYN